MVDTADLKSAERKFMGVRLSPEAQEMVAVAQLARALGCGPRSRGFESRQLPKSRENAFESIFYLTKKCFSKFENK